MAKRRKKMQDMGMVKPALGLTGGAVVLGMGSQVVSSVGGSTAGMGVASRFLSPMGTALGVGLTIRELRKLKRVQKQKRE